MDPSFGIALHILSKSNYNNKNNNNSSVTQLTDNRKKLFIITTAFIFQVLVLYLLHIYFVF